MDFNIFHDQIKKRRLLDQEMLETAFADLAQVLRLPPPGKSTAPETQVVREAIGEVLRMLGAQVPQVPEEIQELNAQLEYMLRPSGVMHRRVELKGAWWKTAVGVMLGSTCQGEIVILRPGKFQGYEWVNMASKEVVALNRQTAGQLSPEAFVFYQPFPSKALRLWDLVCFMGKSLSRGDVFFLLLASLLVAGFGLMLPYATLLVYQSVIPSGREAGIFPLAALLVGATVAATLMGITREVALGRIGNKLNIAMESAAMMRLFALPAAFFKDYTAGELSSRLMNINALTTAITGALLSTGLTALFSLVYVGQMLSFAPPLVLPALLIILVSLAFALTVTLLQLGITRQEMKLSAKLSGLVFALFSAIQKIKIAGAEKRAFAKWARLYKEVGKLKYSPPLLLRLNTTIAGGISLAGALILYYMAARQQIPVAEYIAFSTAYGAVTAGVMALSGVVASLASIKPIMELVQPLLTAVPELSPQQKIITRLSGNIEINNLTFRYDPAGPPILDNLSLKIRAGEYVAVVGQTGCGKSTLMRLLLGFEKAQTGAIYYDGQDTQELDMRSGRQCIGVCLQDGKLFAGDIFSNIIITAPWKTLDDAWEAARIAGIDEEIKAMPMGMHTVLSEGSGGISGGQRQRLMIARAIVAKPRILLFDEATSALDNITQKQVTDSIAALKCTRIVIAHRLSTIIHCDRIILLAGGRIAEEGSYQALMEEKGQFYELAKRQTI